MTPEEERLSAPLERLTPDPPVRITVADIKRSGATRTARSRLWLPALAAACVAVGAATLALTGSEPGGSSAATSNGPSRSVAPSTSASPRAEVVSGPWRSRLLNHEALVPSTLTAGHGLIYALTDSGLVQMDPATGAATASVPVTAQATGPIATAGGLWLATETSPTATTLTEFAVPGLSVLRTRALTSSSPIKATENIPVLAAPSDGGGLVFARGDDLWVLDATTGATVTTAALPGNANGAAIAPDGDAIFVGVATSSGNDWLIRMDMSGDVSAETPVAGDLAQGVTHALVATSGGVWLETGSGSAVGYGFLPNAGPAPHLGDFTAGFSTRPPLVSLAGNVVWLTGPAGIACADPRTGRIRASDHAAGDVLRDVVQVGPRWFALYDNETTDQSGLASISPPAACTRS